MKSFFRRYRAQRRERELVRSARAKAMQAQMILEQSALCSDNSSVGNSCPHNIVVSLTSFPARIATLFIVIESLLQQTLAPDNLLLWLSREDFPGGREDLPQSLLKLERRGLEICFVDANRLSYKKIVHTLEAENYSDSLIITVDDDLMYPVDLIDLFYLEHKKHPEDILCNRARRIMLNEQGTPTSYKQWPLLVGRAESGLSVMPTGNYGVLYPPGSLHTDVTDHQQYQQLAPYGDDLWLKAMSLKNGVQSRVLADRRHHRTRFLSLPYTTGPSLRDSNCSAAVGNDKQMSAVWQHCQLEQYLRSC